ncbi:MAG: S8 family serine peptidase, partial [Clostridia bacterium]
MKKWNGFKVIIFVLAILAVLLFAKNAQAAGREDGYSGFLFRMENATFMDISPRGSVAGDVQQVRGASGWFMAGTLEDIHQFAAGSRIIHVEPNYRVSLFTAPNDPGYGDQKKYLDLIGFATVWPDGLDGTGVTVAVIDSGLVSVHEDLDGTGILPGVNFTDSGEAWEVTDSTGHGTFVSGIMKATTDNGLGITGMSDVVNILPLKVFKEPSTTLDLILGAMDEAITRKVDVINMSFGMPSYSLAMHQLVQEASDAGILLVAAVGNASSATLYYPAAYAEVAGVGAVDWEGLPATFSQRNTSVHVTAPGVGVFSLSYSSSNGYSQGNGTSFAAPFVSSVAAMAKQYDRDVHMDSFLTLLALSATDKGEEGYDTDYGWGILSLPGIHAALEASYSLTYHLNEGSFHSGTEVPVSYTVRSDGLDLPVPVRTSHVFNGWFSNEELTGNPVVMIAAGSLGDKTYHASWTYEPDMDASLSSVTVAGHVGVQDASDEAVHRVEVPAQTDRATITPEDIEIVPEKPLASAGIPSTTDEGLTWHVTVTAADGSTTMDHTIEILLSANHAPVASEGLVAREGQAAPASLDGLTPAVAFTADMDVWFTDADGDAMSYDIVSATPAGQVQLEGSMLVFTPVAEDAGAQTLIEVKASDGIFDSLSSVTVTVTVSGFPVSHSLVQPVEATFDLHAEGAEHRDITVEMTLYGNVLTHIGLEEIILVPETDYIVLDATVTVKASFLSTLEAGQRTLAFVFDRGIDALLAIDIVDTTPPFIPVSDLTGIPGSMTAGYQMALNATVVPADATNKTVAWGISNAGGTGASLSGNVLTVPSPGTVVLTATVTGGLEGGDFVKDFTVNADPLPPPPVMPSFSGGGFIMDSIYLTTTTGSASLPYSYSAFSRTIGISIFTDLLSKSLADREASGSIAFDMSKFTDAHSLNLRKDNLAEIALACQKEARWESVTLLFGHGRIILDGQAMQSILDQAKTDRIIFKLYLEEMEDEADDKAMILDFSITSGIVIDSFLGKGTVHLQYPLEKGKDPGGIAVQMILSGSKLTNLSSVYDKVAEEVVFFPSRSARYALSYDLLNVWVNPFDDISP